MAVAGLTAAMEKGVRVPRELSIIAWDDSVLCEHTFPRLTALRHDVLGFGAHVARRLFGLIDGAEAGSFGGEAAQLTVRSSTVAPPDRAA
ncbi:substrate-binding domain-containing protein [Microbacterium amylolyticum]|uniref:DNA-binding LacI/PurR family transcriptional regulator n=1 Tax=Microbacterium amylolyticum TaxID=936337 RepID=A0ABS4ZJP7_9MICO|nr:DNA-binding LacI/PurR family transcriptional regulator [Microbacterium amylolyticum]